jgi:hypothetical protein
VWMLSGVEGPASRSMVGDGRFWKRKSSYWLGLNSLREWNVHGQMRRRWQRFSGVLFIVAKLDAESVHCDESER